MFCPVHCIALHWTDKKRNEVQSIDVIWVTKRGFWGVRQVNSSSTQVEVQTFFVVVVVVVLLLQIRSQELCESLVTWQQLVVWPGFRDFTVNYNEYVVDHRQPLDAVRHQQSRLQSANSRTIKLERTHTVQPSADNAAATWRIPKKLNTTFFCNS